MRLIVKVLIMDERGVVRDDGETRWGIPFVGGAQSRAVDAHTSYLLLGRAV